MGGNQTKSVKNVIEDSAITATSEVLLKNAEHQKNVDNIDLTAKGNIEIGSIDVAQNASYSIKSVNLNGMNNNFMNSMSSNLATLLKQSSGTLANQNTDVISDQIKSTFNATVSMKNVVDNINTTINKANIDLKADGNIKVGSITMNASITIVKSEVRSQIQSSDFANKLMAELKIEATQSQKGVFAVIGDTLQSFSETIGGSITSLSKTLGIGYLGTVFIIGFVIVAGIISITYLLSAIFGGSSGGNYRGYAYIPPPRMQQL